MRSLRKKKKKQNKPKMITSLAGFVGRRVQIVTSLSETMSESNGEQLAQATSPVGIEALLAGYDNEYLYLSVDGVEVQQIMRKEEARIITLASAVEEDNVLQQLLKQLPAPKANEVN